MPSSRRSAPRKSWVFSRDLKAATASRNTSDTSRGYGAICNARWRIRRWRGCGTGTARMCPCRNPVRHRRDRRDDRSMPTAPRTAMVLAAGLGERMRPLTDRMPKPLVSVAGRPLIDHVLDRLAAAGIERAVVNVHYLADMIEGHLKGRTRPQILISDERQALLNTGGGVVKALPTIGAEPFIHVNSDTIWIDGVK